MTEHPEFLKVMTHDYVQWKSCRMWDCINTMYVFEKALNIQLLRCLSITWTVKINPKMRPLFSYGTYKNVKYPHEVNFLSLVWERKKTVRTHGDALLCGHVEHFSRGQQLDKFIVRGYHRIWLAGNGHQRYHSQGIPPSLVNCQWPIIIIT